MSGTGCGLSESLTAALLPPPNESEAEHERRLRSKDDDEAKHRSESTDKMLRDDETGLYRKKAVEVLLGQSESGKSATVLRVGGPSTGHGYASSGPQVHRRHSLTSRSSSSEKFASFRISRSSSGSSMATHRYR